MPAPMSSYLTTAELWSGKKYLIYLQPQGLFIKAQGILQQRHYSVFIKSDQDHTNPQVIFNELEIKVEDYWEDLYKAEIRSQMIDQLKNKAGIYILINKVSRNYYVGSAGLNRLYTRFVNHTINFHGNKIVKRAVMKVGLNNFIFAILEYYPVLTTETNKNLTHPPLKGVSVPSTNSRLSKSNYNEYRANLFELETMYITALSPKYNILLEAGTSIGYKHTDETIKKLKESFTEERRKLISKLQSNLPGPLRSSGPRLIYPPARSAGVDNRVVSKATKDKLRLIALNRPSNYLTEKGRLIISKSSSKIVQLFDLDDKYLCEFFSIKSASHYLCCSYNTIQRSLNSGWIYIPNIFIDILNDEYIKNHNHFMSSNHITNEDKYFINARGKIIKKKSGLFNYTWNTKILIKLK